LADMATAKRQTPTVQRDSVTERSGTTGYADTTRPGSTSASAASRASASAARVRLLNGGCTPSRLGSIACIAPRFPPVPELRQQSCQVAARLLHGGHGQRQADCPHAPPIMPGRHDFLEIGSTPGFPDQPGAASVRRHDISVALHRRLGEEIGDHAQAETAGLGSVQNRKPVINRCARWPGQECRQPGISALRLLIDRQAPSLGPNRLLSHLTIVVITAVRSRLSIRQASPRRARGPRCSAPGAAWLTVVACGACPGGAWSPRPRLRS
jgi:hypothetical protein